MHCGGSEEHNKSNEHSAGPEFELRPGTVLYAARIYAYDENECHIIKIATI